MSKPVASADRITPDPDRPFFWRFYGRPMVLLGGSSEDNLFQVKEVERELDAIRAHGGNYVRCTMSSRDPGDVWPFAQGADGRYDLDHPSDEYWGRFERFVQATHERAIVMQIELWDRFDYAREPWLANPFNPANNSNYTAEESGLEEAYPDHPGHIDHPFFRTVPELDNHPLLLPIQERMVDRLLEITLPYDHVLYCMDNETHVRPQWPHHWARRILAAAKRRGVPVNVTEMWDRHDLADPQHRGTFDHPDLFNFLDVSQNNQKKGQIHWDNLIAQRQRVIDSGVIRPLNNVKVYGADTGPYGTTRDGIERFWQNLFGGCASTRFHRPPSGLGSSQTALRHVRAARALCDAIDPTRCEPRNDLLGDRTENGAYCMAAGEALAVFFPDGGGVRLDLSGFDGPLDLTWLDFDSAGWSAAARADRGDAFALRAPGDGYQVALLRRR